MSLEALIQDRKTKQAGRLHKQFICLDTDLIEQRADILDAIDNLSDGGERLASTNKARKELDAQLDEVEKAMAEVTVQMVFRSMNFTAFEKLLEEHQKLVEVEEGRTEKQLDGDTFLPELARRCFVEFRQNGVKVDSLTAEHFADLLDTLPHGEADMLYFQLRALHMGEVDLPKSVKRSALTRG